MYGQVSAATEGSREASRYSQVKFYVNAWDE